MESCVSREDILDTVKGNEMNEENHFIYNETKVTFNIVGAELDTLIYKSLVECSYEVTCSQYTKVRK